MTHPLLGGYALQRSHAPVTCNSKLPRCYTKMAIVAEQMILGMWPTILHLLSPKQHSMITILHLLSPKQHSMIRVVHIPHIGTKRKPLTKAGSPNILVHVVATYDAFQAVLGFLCRHVLGCLPDVHSRTDAFAAYNGMIRGYTENLVIRCTLVINRIIFCHDHL